MFYVEELGLDLHCRYNLYQKNNIFDLMASKSVLDVGCGTGFFASKIAQQAEKVTAIDVDEQNIKLAQELNKSPKVEFLTGDGSRLPFGQGCFDVVFCASVLEHFPDPTKAIHEFRRVLKDGGRLILGYDKKPALSHWAYLAPAKLTQWWLASTDNAQSHKRTIFSDDTDKSGLFLNQEKLENFLAQYFNLKVKDAAGGLFTNLFIALTVSLEKTRNILAKQSPQRSNMTFNYQRLNSPLLKLYRGLCLPVAKFICAHDILRNDAQFCLLVCRKKPANMIK